MFASELAGIASRAANDDIEFLHLALLFGVAPSSFAERHPGKTRRIRGQSFGTRIQQKARSTDGECVPGRTAPGNSRYLIDAGVRFVNISSQKPLSFFARFYLQRYWKSVG